MTTIEYRPIAGFPGYRVGSDGSVWSLRRKGRRFASSPSEPLTSGVWRRLRTPILRTGYASIKLRHCGREATLLVHRVVLEAFVGPCPPGLEACHDPDPKRSNCRLENLRWGTRQSNADDQAKHGTRQRGERNAHARLTEAAVRQARHDHANGLLTIAQLAQMYGVSRVTMAEVLRRATWKHVP